MYSDIIIVIICVCGLSLCPLFHLKYAKCEGGKWNSVFGSILLRFWTHCEEFEVEEGRQSIYAVIYCDAGLFSIWNSVFAKHASTFSPESFEIYIILNHLDVEKRKIGKWSYCVRCSVFYIWNLQTFCSDEWNVIVHF